MQCQQMYIARSALTVEALLLAQPVFLDITSAVVPALRLPLLRTVQMG